MTIDAWPVRVSLRVVERTGWIVDTAVLRAISTEHKTSAFASHKLLLPPPLFYDDDDDGYNIWSSHVKGAC